MGSVTAFPTCLFIFGYLLQSCCALVIQPDDVDSGDYDYVQNDSRLCARQCKVGQLPRTCYYKFTLESYTVLGPGCGACPLNSNACRAKQCVTADGYERKILVVNRRMPGPSIQVCKGDTIVVDVHNKLPGQSTTIHWHGISQKGTPYMDGTPMITQCPIMEGQNFRYKFLAEDQGTYFWHSHDGLQKVDGIIGSLVVREPKDHDPNWYVYDVDLPSHVLLIQDWLHEGGDERFPGFVRNRIGQNPNTYLINGKGLLSNNSSTRVFFDSTWPVSKFEVEHGRRYRFRLIGGTCLSCPFQLTFGGHRIHVIATDGSHVQPVTVGSVVISSGERFDIVLEAMRPISSYWILVRGIGSCSNAYQVAVLKYRGSTETWPMALNSALTGLPSGLVLNPSNVDCESNTHSGVCVSQLQSTSPAPVKLLKSVPDLRLLFAFGFHYFTYNELFGNDQYHKYLEARPGLLTVGMINNISNILPPSPIISQHRDVPKELYCKVKCQQVSKLCECLHIIKIPLGSVVEIIIADTTPPNPIRLVHPFHIHGHRMYIMEQGVFHPPLDKTVATLNMRLESGEKLQRYLPKKDTVSVPTSGYTIVRILADNPGFWLFHCHFIYHLVSGMSLVIQVGELQDLPPVPEGFPKCGSYLPPI